MAATVTRSQDDNVSVARIACVAIPPGIVRHLPVPLWLCLEVARLWLVVLQRCRDYRFARGVVAVVVDWHIAKKSEEDDQGCDYSNRSYYWSAAHGSARNPECRMRALAGAEAYFLGALDRTFMLRLLARAFGRDRSVSQRGAA